MNSSEAAEEDALYLFRLLAAFKVQLPYTLVVQLGSRPRKHVSGVLLDAQSGPNDGGWIMPGKPKLTPEERLARPAFYRERYRERARLRYHAKRALMTPEELAEFNRRSRINRKASYQRNKAQERAKAQALYRTPEGKAKQSARNKARRAQNPEFWRAYDKLAYQRNREGNRRAQRRWVANNRARTVLHTTKRRARMHSVSRNDVTPEQRDIVLAAAHGTCVYCAYYNPTCALCPKGAHKGLAVDHITPLVLGGDNTLHNLGACCKSCTSKKRTQPNPVPVQPLLL